jgi:hypothetical protein
MERLAVGLSIAWFAVPDLGGAQSHEERASRGQELSDASLIDRDLGFELVKPGPGWELWGEAQAAAVDPEACAGLWHLGLGVCALVRVRPDEDLDREALFGFYRTALKAELLGPAPSELRAEEPLHLSVKNERAWSLSAELFVHHHAAGYAELEIAYAGELPTELRSSLVSALRLDARAEPRLRQPLPPPDENTRHGMRRAGRFLDLEVGFALALPAEWRLLLRGAPNDLSIEDRCAVAHRTRPLRGTIEARRVPVVEQERRWTCLRAAHEGAELAVVSTPLGELLLRVSNERREVEVPEQDTEIPIEVERVDAWLRCGEWMLRFDLRGVQASRAEMRAALEALIAGLELLPAEELAARRTEHRAWLARAENDPESGVADERALQRGTYENFAAGWRFRRQLSDSFTLELGPGGDEPELIGWDAQRELRFELRTRKSEAELDEAHSQALGADRDAAETRQIYWSMGPAILSWLEPDQSAEKSWGCVEKRQVLTFPLGEGRFVELRLQAPGEVLASNEASWTHRIYSRLKLGGEPLQALEEHGEGWIAWARGHALLPPLEGGWKRSENARGWLVLSSRAGSLRTRPVPFTGPVEASRRRRQELEVIVRAVTSCGRDLAGSATRELDLGRLGELPARGYAFELGPAGREVAAELWIAWQGNQLHQFLLAGRPAEPLGPELSALARSFFRNL